MTSAELEFNHLYIERRYLSVFLFFSGLQVKKLDDSEFRNAFSRGFVRVCINLDA